MDHKVNKLVAMHMLWMTQNDNADFWEQYTKVGLAFEQGWHWLFTNREIDKLAGLVSNEFEESIFTLLKDFFYVNP